MDDSNITVIEESSDVVALIRELFLNLPEPEPGLFVLHVHPSDVLPEVAHRAYIARIDQDFHIEHIDVTDRLQEITKRTRASFIGMARSFEGITLAINEVAQIGRSLERFAEAQVTRKAARLFEIDQMRAINEYAHKPNLPEAYVPGKKKKRGHNSALDRVICKAAYC